MKRRLDVVEGGVDADPAEPDPWVPGTDVPAELAAEITGALAIPTIGIGAGVDCDGQVLVMHDLLGLTDAAPGFAKQYANLGALTVQAARRFADEVAHAKFPDAEHSYR